MKLHVLDIVICLAILLCTWFGLVQGMDGPRHLLQFYVWGYSLPVCLLLFVGFLAMEQAGPDSWAKIIKPSPAWKRAITVPAYWSAIGLQVWTGAIAAPFILILMALSVRAVRREARRLIDKAGTAA